ncbi:hypothetical protein SPHINGO8BC_140136 [Sphingobacterium multivorum]|uniref:Uncharacterized protein n=1 Tax=Sphingobacterium multivorum TaxID=28454 RepID=A0A653ZE16_SPHMU|nr:hypothetical protein SPHINGO8BC_140136 [Sphingobacterium multivorum]
MAHDRENESLNRGSFKAKNIENSNEKGFNQRAKYLFGTTGILLFAIQRF